MSKSSEEIISIKVAGVEYQLHCPKDEQRGLLNAADYLNKKIRKIKRQAKFLSIERASVLAGLEVANELLNSDKVEISESNAQEVTSEQKIVENKEVITDKQNSNKTEDLSIKLVSEISELSKL